MSTLTFATYKKAHKTNTLVFSYAPIFFNILTFSIFCGADGSHTHIDFQPYTKEGCCQRCSFAISFVCLALVIAM